MTISDLIKRLEGLRAKHGDIPVYVSSDALSDEVAVAFPIQAISHYAPDRGLYGQSVAPYPTVVIS